MSFLLEVSAQELVVREGGQEPTLLTVRLLHRPLRDVDVSLESGGNRIRVEPAALRFTRDDWETPQDFSLVAANDEAMQSVALEAVDVHVVSSESTAWPAGLDGVVRVMVEDDDVAALVARFNRA